LSDLTIAPAGFDLVDFVAKLDMMETVLNGKVFERPKEIETMIVALLASKNHGQIGPPGIAKSMIITLMHQLIEGARHFRRLITRFSVPEELFGPISMRGLENDKYARLIVGKLPDADMAFLDEIFKGGSSILNSLLSIMAEGIFDNDGAPVYCKPVIYCASNELPVNDTELAALVDRVNFKHLVKPLQSNGNRLRMLRARANRAFEPIEVEPVISWPEISMAQKEVEKVKIPDEVLRALVEVWGKLNLGNVEPTDRKFNDCIDIIQATALRKGRMEADINDMKLLRHALWTDPSEINKVNELILELANPIDLEAGKLNEELDGLINEVQEILSSTDNIPTRRRRAVDVNGKLTRMGTDLANLEAKAEKTGRRADEIPPVKAKLGGVVTLLLKELFNMERQQKGTSA